MEGNAQIDALRLELTGSTSFTSTYDESITSTAVFDDVAARQTALAAQSAANLKTQAELAAMTPTELARYSSDQNFKTRSSGNSAGLSQEYLAAGASLPTGTMSPINAIDGYFTFNKFGQFQKGFGDAIRYP